jgi:predicted aspartyl protease
MVKKHEALTYRYTGLMDSIVTSVEVFSDVYDEVTSYLTNALWDTGAMGSVIAPTVASKLNLDIVDTVEITGINGTSMAEVTVISVHFPNSAIISDLRVAVCDMSPETEMILGMDAITQLDFAITNGDGQTQFSFVIPPYKDKIDFTNS